MLDPHPGIQSELRYDATTTEMSLPYCFILGCQVVMTEMSLPTWNWSRLSRSSWAYM